MDNTTQMGIDHCPVCQKICNTATPPDDSKIIPKPGDLSICFSCGAYLQFAPDMALQELTPEVWNRLDFNVKVQLNTIHRAVKRRIQEKNQS